MGHLSRHSTAADVTYMVDHIEATSPGQTQRAVNRSPVATALFVGEFLRAPLKTASVLPSSPRLAERMVEPLRGGANGRQAPVVVELGPGTGSFTEAVRRVIPRDSRQVAVEINPKFAAHLRRRCPWLEVIQASAADLASVLLDHQIPAPNLVLSGLPWQCYRGSAGPALARSIASALRPGGAFTQITYTWTRWTQPARRQRSLLESAFDRVDVSGTVWRNAPPAFVYTCRTGF